MSETPQQYTQRILGYVEGDEPLAILAATPQKLDRLIGDAPTDRLLERPRPEQWSVREILAHLADAEIVVGFRLRLVLGAPGTAIVAYDQDTWATSGHYDKRDPRTLLGQFCALRESNLELLKSLEPEQWEHWGVHSERGKETIAHMVRMFAGHDLNHLQQIEARLVPEPREDRADHVRR